MSRYENSDVKLNHRILSYLSKLIEEIVQQYFFRNYSKLIVNGKKLTSIQVL